MPFEFSADLLKMAYCFLRVKTFTTAQANFSLHLNAGRVNAPAEQLFHFFANHFPATNGAFLNGHHLIASLFAHRSILPDRATIW